MDNKYTIVKYEDNWADEMDIAGFAIVPTVEWEEFELLVTKLFKIRDTFTFYIGTNEDIEYNSKDELMRCFDAHELSEPDLDAFKVIFDWNTDAGNCNFGFSFLDMYAQMEEIVAEEEEQEEESI